MPIVYNIRVTTQETKMITKRQAAQFRHNASLNRHADVFTGCLKAGTLKQTHHKVVPLKILGKKLKVSA
jgi:hypothetical protein